VWGAEITGTSFDVTDLREIQRDRVDDLEAQAAMQNSFVQKRCRSEFTVDYVKPKVPKCRDRTSTPCSDEWKSYEKARKNVPYCGDRVPPLCDGDFDQKVYFGELERILVTNACADDSIGKGLARRLIHEDVSSEILREKSSLGPISASLSLQLLDPKCAAAKVLTDDDRRRLKDFAKGS
jgi:hypothetical protein